MRKAAGFTLVEVLVALIVLALGALAMAGILHQAAVAARDADGRERLIWALTAVADSLAAMPTWTPGERWVEGAGRIRWRSGASEGWVGALPEGGDSVWLELPMAPDGERPLPVGDR